MKLKFIIFFILILLYNSFSMSAENKPYHHLPDGTFRNPEGSPKIEDFGFKWSFKVFNKEKKKIKINFPSNHVVGKQEILNNLKKFKNDDYIGIIFNGIVIRGETIHYQLVTNEAFRSIGSLAESFCNIAIINNVICVENLAQLEKRLLKNTKNNTYALIELINEKSS